MAVALCLGASMLPAQTPGSLAAERARLAEITGDTTRVAGERSPLLTDAVPLLKRLPRADRLPLSLVMPELRVTWNSSIPYSLNDGGMWAGRGLSTSLMGGIAYERRYMTAMIRAVLAPALHYSQNLPFQTFPSTTPGRSQYSNPFHGIGASLDLPHRFGDRHLLAVEPGRSGLSITTPRVTAGVTADNEWWGPAIRNTLIMSSNARGIPRMYVGTPKPVRTRIGAVQAKLIAGTLTESFFFDANTGNDYRALSGLRLQLTPAFDSTLTFGFARVVYTTIPLSLSGTLTHAFDVFTRWEYITSVADTLPNGRSTQQSDQIMSVFARWIFPEAGFEVYGEWARMDLPRTGTELLVAGHHTGGYTLGFQWAQPRRKRDYLRLQSEITYLEQSRVFPDRPPPDFYSGRATSQGYTNRGQVVGAAIGPGASSQFIAIDYLAPSWQSGWFVGRVRWDNDALYRVPGANFFSHDVTMLTGLRGGWRTKYTDFSAESTFAYRFNYLFQFGAHNPGGFRTVDVRNLTLSLVATPR